MPDNPLTRVRWSPFVVGAGIGLLSWFAFATVDHGIGVTGAFEAAATLILRALGLADDGGDAPKIGWEWTLLLGLLAGAWISARLSGDHARESVPAMWAARFGERPGPRLAVAFVGGFLLMFGARLARGCTSGHGITGALQLAVSSWVFLVGLFVSGGLVARLMFRGEAGRRV
ncbi:MAG: YeeE/YedE family protein [Myxococcales bacterium]|nr:YeeE/YedE family protein [Myxococcales bacterium]